MSPPPPDGPGSSSHPWVYSATITGDTITFRVEVTDLQTTVGAIEVTGMATQVNGAYAPIFAITKVPAEPNGDPGDPRYFVDVAGIPAPGHPFRPDEDLTVFTRASKVWVTVLGAGSDEGAAETETSGNPGPTWGKHRADAHLDVPASAVPVGTTLPEVAASASHPWVYSAAITGNSITFHVEVSDFKTSVGAIEITGLATQVNGAYAPIFGVKNVPAAPNGDPADQDQTGRYFVDVGGIPTPEHPFTPTKDVTIFTRASKVWVTVLGPGSDDAAIPVPTWGKHKADSHMNAPDGDG